MNIYFRQGGHRRRGPEDRQEDGGTLGSWGPPGRGTLVSGTLSPGDPLKDWGPPKGLRELREKVGVPLQPDDTSQDG